MKRIFTTAVILALVFLDINSFAQQWNQVGYMIVNGTDTVSGAKTIRGFGNNVYAGTTKGLFSSPNNGGIWTNITYNASVIAGEDITCVFVASNFDIYAGSSKRLYKSEDNGATWSWLNSLPDNLTYRDITEANGYIVVSYMVNFTTGGVYYSDDAGANWTLAAGLPDLLMNHFLVNGDSLFLGGKNGVYISTSSGQSWSVSGTSSTTMISIYDVLKSSGGLWAGDNNGSGLFASFDSGSTWDNIDTNNFNPFCQVFSLTESGDMILAALDGAGNCTGIKMSNDTGNTWNVFMTGLPAGFYPIVGRNASGSFFFTKKGTQVYRYDLVTGIAAASHEQKVLIYPNPFNSLTTIEINPELIRMSAGAEINLVMYDVLGHEISKSKINSPKSQIQRGNVASGMYFFQLQCDKEILGRGRVIIE